MAGKINFIEKAVTLLLEKAGEELDTDTEEHTGLSQEFDALLNAEDEAEYVPNEGQSSLSLFFLD